MRIRAFITHKKAEMFVDCQDRFGIDKNTKSIAVSDGMSQSWQQKIWAQLLVEKFVGDNDWLPSDKTIKPLCTQWHERVVEFIEHLKASESPLNLIYRNERNLAEGKSAGATFVGIRFKGMEWNGSVLGDSCLIEWKEDNATFFTSQSVDSFDNHPDYFDSNILNEGKGTPISICGVLDNKTCLFLVSDPFSDFLFEHNKQGDVAMYMQQLLKISSHEEFETLVDEWRKAGMHNDDTTLVIVESDDSDDFSFDRNSLDDINELIDEEKKLIEENKKGKISDQMVVHISNKQTESESDTNTLEDEDRQVKQTEKQIPSPQLTIRSDNTIEEYKEDENVNIHLAVEPDDSDNTSIDKNVIDNVNKPIEKEKGQIEEKKQEETEQIPAPISTKIIERESFENITETGKKQELFSAEQKELPCPNHSSNKENVKNTFATESKQEVSPVDEGVFLVEFLSEYKNALQKKYTIIGDLKFQWTQKAISEAIKVMFEKYSINLK